MRRKHSLLLMLLFFSAGLLHAQQKLTLDLEGAVKYALQYNKTMKNSGMAVDQAGEKLKEAIANGLPQLNAAVDYSNALGAKIKIRFNPDMPVSEIPIKPTSNFNLNVGQLLFSGSYLVGIQSAKLFKSLTEKSLEKTELEIISQVTEGYHLVLVSQELLKIMEQNRVNLQEVYRKTEPLVRVGMIEKTDLDQLSVQVTSLQNAVNASERQLELATNMLRLQLGVPAETEIELTETLAQMLEEPAFEAPLLQSFTLEQNVDYQLMNYQEKMSAKMVDLQKTHSLPTLSGFYSFTHKLLKPDFDMSPANIVGLKMNIPVFSSGLRNAQLRQAQIDLETARNNKALLADQLHIQEKQLRFNLTNALENYTNQKNNVEVSRRVYASLNLKYTQGLISSLDLITADNNYLRAETDYISSVLQVLQARTELEKIYGSLKQQ